MTVGSGSPASTNNIRRRVSFGESTPALTYAAARRANRAPLPSNGSRGGDQGLRSGTPSPDQAVAHGHQVNEIQARRRELQEHRSRLGDQDSSVPYGEEGGIGAVGGDSLPNASVPAGNTDVGSHVSGGQEPQSCAAV